MDVQGCPGDGEGRVAPWWGGCGRDAASGGLGVHPAVSLAWLQDCGIPRNPDYGPRLALSPVPESRPLWGSWWLPRCVFEKDAESPNSLQP